MKVFLVDFYSQVPIESHDFREPSSFPVRLERLLNEKPFLCRKVPRTIDPLVVQEFFEREWKYLPRQSPTTHLRGDFLRKHPGRRARDVDLALFSSHQAVHKRLPPVDRLDLVKKAVDRFDILFLRIVENNRPR